MTRRVLLIGGAGQLGSELRRQAPDFWDVMAPARAELDAFDPEALAGAVDALRPDLVVNCSAFHAVDLCESRFADALAVNAVAVSSLAKAAERVGATFVTVSTDYAFDGRSRVPYRETDEARPIQAYGVSKVSGELAALAAHPEGAVVLRSCGLYGLAASRQKGGNFVLNRLKEGAKVEPLQVGCDLRCTPTSAADLAEAMIALLAADAPAGLYHLTNSGSCDWATFTAEAYRLAGLLRPVEGVDRRGRYAPARRPVYSVLDGAKAAAFGVRMRPWQEALAEYVAQVAR